MITLTSHCEAQPKQSRQKRWIAASRSALLAMTISVMVFSSSALASCPRIYSFEQVLEKHKDIVVEATFSKYEVIPIPASKGEHPRQIVAQHFAVTKNWNGSKKDQHFKVAAGFGVTLEGNVPPERKTLTEGEGPFIFLLKSGQNGSVTRDSDGDEIFSSCTEMAPVTPENLALLEKKFPQGPTQ